MGSIDGGTATMPSNLTIPNITETIAVAKIPISIAPRTRCAINVRIMSIPKIEINTGADWISPSVTNVFVCNLIIPDIRRPINAINAPIPTAIALCKEDGKAFITAARKPTNDSMTNNIPDKKTMLNAYSHCNPRP